MLSRRVIRIKAFQVLFAFESSHSESIDSAEKELLLSCEKCRDLYYFLLNVCSPLVRVAEDKIEALKGKFNPTEEEANPNYKFVENRFVKLLEADADFQKFCKKKALGWEDYDVLVKKIYASIVASDYYKEYMSSDENSLAKDCELFRHIFEEEFEDNEMLEKILEEMSIYWIDDLCYCLNVILKAIDDTAKSGKLFRPQLFFSYDDEDFAVRLLRASILNYEDYTKLIYDNLTNWDPDRIVLTDATLIVQGLAEAVTFHEIPLKVTLNEYVDLAKFYSTQNSRVFVNGLLDRLIQKKLESGEIVKTGRGLIDGK